MTIFPFFCLLADAFSPVVLRERESIGILCYLFVMLYLVGMLVGSVLL